MMINNSDPWEGIEAPAANGLSNAKRVANQCWNFYWAKNSDSQCLLILKHNVNPFPKTLLPKLRGLEVRNFEAGDGGSSSLIVSLLDSTQRDIFHRLCIDVVESVGRVKVQEEIVTVFLARTWRWHYLLAGGRDGKLSSEEQKGLIGELKVIDELLLSVLSARDAMMAWTGPSGSPKDFVVGRISIEAKAGRGGARPFVSISSEFQLDTEGVDALFLHVVELGVAPTGANDAFSITEAASRIRGRIAINEPDVLDLFDSKLFEYGFRWEDSYEECMWLEGDSKIFEVRDTFPRIESKDLRPGVGYVRYSIGLKECELYRVTADVVRRSLKDMECVYVSG
jgi:hypothetical protein